MLLWVVWDFKPAWAKQLIARVAKLESIVPNTLKQDLDTITASQAAEKPVLAQILAGIQSLNGTIQSLNTQIQNGIITPDIQAEADAAAADSAAILANAQSIAAPFIPQPGGPTGG